MEKSRGSDTESWDPPTFVGQGDEEKSGEENEKAWTFKWKGN